MIYCVKANLKSIWIMSLNTPTHHKTDFAANLASCLETNFINRKKVSESLINHFYVNTFQNAIILIRRNSSRTIPISHLFFFLLMISDWQTGISKLSPIRNSFFFFNETTVYRMISRWANGWKWYIPCVPSHFAKYILKSK